MLERRRRQQRLPEPFWPSHIIKEAVVILVVFVALVLIVVFFPVSHESVARPLDTTYIPRPEWYFLFLFKTLQYFPGKLEVVGAIIVPGIAGAILLLLPFFDRKSTMGLRRRPLASVAGLFVIATFVSLTMMGIAGTPPAITSRPALITLGEELYQKQGCSSCHTINGIGTPAGPDLAGIAQRRTLSWVHIYLEDPLQINLSSNMPGYLASLTHEEIEAVSLYLISQEKTPKTIGTAPAQATPTAPPQVPHTLEGRTACLLCHQDGIGGATKIPTNHSGRSNEVCLSCHQAK